jgi:hypothetical protein
MTGAIEEEEKKKGKKGETIEWIYYLLHINL